MEVLLSTGVGLETAIKHVAEGGYGKISQVFQSVVARSGTQYLADILSKVHDAADSRGFKRVLYAMVQAARGETSDLATTLKQIAEVETKVRRSRLEAYVQRLSTVGELYMALAFILPIIMVGFAVVQALVGAAGVIRGSTQGSVFSPAIFLAFGVNALCMFGLIYYSKLIEPEV